MSGWLKREPAPLIEANDERDKLARPLAESFVSHFRKTGVRLDYSADSLATVDAILDEMRGRSRKEMSKLLVMCGCYIGEVVLRKHGGAWRQSSETPMPDGGIAPLLLELPGGTLVNPIGEACKRFDNSAAQSVASLLSATASHDKKEASASVWPTPLQADGTAPVLLKLLGVPDPVLARQAAYLVFATNALKDSGYEVDAVQQHLGTADHGVAVPAVIKDRHGSPAAVFTNSESWGADALDALRVWIVALRRAGVGAHVPVIVVAQEDSPDVRAMREVGQFIHFRAPTAKPKAVRE
jgi:hypothetical protein